MVVDISELTGYRISELYSKYCPVASVSVCLKRPHVSVLDMLLAPAHRCVKTDEFVIGHTLRCFFCAHLWWVRWALSTQGMVLLQICERHQLCMYDSTFVFATSTSISDRFFGMKTAGVCWLARTSAF